jgi:uncharacterized protein
MQRIEIKLAADDVDAKTGEFGGYGAVFGNVDSYGDVIERGAFKETLREWEALGKLPPMLLQHGGGGMLGGAAEDLLPVGQWVKMEENSKGLKVEGKLFALGTEKGQYIYEGLKTGVLDGLSIGFRTRKFTEGTKAGEPRRKLQDVELVEVSIVTFPANGKARVHAVKAAESILTITDFETFLREVGGFSRGEAKDIASVGFRKAMADRREVGSVEAFDAAVGRLLETLK